MKNHETVGRSEGSSEREVVVGAPAAGPARRWSRVARRHLAIPATSCTSAVPTEIEVKPTRPFLADSLVLEATDLTDWGLKISVGGNPQGLSNNYLPGAMFGPTSTANNIGPLDVAEPATPIALTALQSTGGALTLSGAFVGYEVEAAG